MRSIQLTLEYDGTAYAGWQRQENALAVQQVVEEELSQAGAGAGRCFSAPAARTRACMPWVSRAHFDTNSSHSPGEIQPMP